MLTYPGMILSRCSSNRPSPGCRKNCASTKPPNRSPRAVWGRRSRSRPGLAVKADGKGLDLACKILMKLLYAPGEALTDQCHPSFTLYYRVEYLGLAKYKQGSPTESTLPTGPGPDSITGSLEHQANKGEQSGSVSALTWMLRRRTLPMVVSMSLPATPAATLTRPASLAFSPPITSSRRSTLSFFLTYLHRPFPLYRFKPHSVPDLILVPRAAARVLSFD